MAGSLLRIVCDKRRSLATLPVIVLPRFLEHYAELDDFKALDANAKMRRLNGGNALDPLYWNRKFGIDLARATALIVFLNLTPLVRAPSLDAALDSAQHLKCCLLGLSVRHSEHLRRAGRRVQLVSTLRHRFALLRRNCGLRLTGTLANVQVVRVATEPTLHSAFLGVCQRTSGRYGCCLG